MSTLAVKVVLDTRRALIKNAGSKDPIYPIKLRVTYARKQRYYPLDVNAVSKADWEKIQSGQRMSKSQRKVFHTIREYEGRAIEITDTLHPFSFHAFDTRWKSSAMPTHSSKSFQAVFKEYIEDLRRAGRASTTSSYQCAFNSLTSFSKNLAWNDLTPEFLEEYEAYMREEGKSQNTIGIYLRSLRAVINYGITNGLFAKEYYPFGRKSHGKYQIPAAQNKKRALSKKEVEAIKALEVKPGSRKELARDFWLFSYYANGCNIKDIVHLRWKDIDWKEGVIQFVRKKTERANKSNQVQITAVIHPHITEVIQRRGVDDSQPENYVFSIIDANQTAEEQHKHTQEFVRRINIGLKQIAKELNLTKNLTTYTARHSHAYALLMGGASLEVIMDQFKHSSMKTTMNYIDSIDNEKRKDIAKLL
ncbi:site-specific integrase [Schleiferiaceae bacterium]|nr:site-specific integrase [Schleiferiaceae bacterium]